MRKFSKLPVVAALGLVVTTASPVLAIPVYVAGFDTNNVVKFETPTGLAEEVIAFLPRVAPDTGPRPRGVALDDDGRIYVGLRGDSLNVKRFAPDGTFLDDFTASAGGFGLGQIAFGPDGDLFAAGDVSAGSAVFRYDGLTGALIDEIHTDQSANVLAIEVAGDTLYAANFFNDLVVKYDLSGADPAELIPTGLVHPHGLTIGHTGNLFVGGRDKVIENPGPSSSVFIDLLALGIGDEVSDFAYEPRTGHYFMTQFSDSLFEFDQAGTLVGTYQSPLLAKARGIAFGQAAGISEPPTYAIIAFGLVALWLTRQGRGFEL